MLLSLALLHLFLIAAFTRHTYCTTLIIHYFLHVIRNHEFNHQILRFGSTFCQLSRLKNGRLNLVLLCHSHNAHRSAFKTRAVANWPHITSAASHRLDNFIILSGLWVSTRGRFSMVVAKSGLCVSPQDITARIADAQVDLMITTY